MRTAALEKIPCHRRFMVEDVRRLRAEFAGQLLEILPARSSVCVNQDRMAARFTRGHRSGQPRRPGANNCDVSVQSGPRLCRIAAARPCRDEPA